MKSRSWISVRSAAPIIAAFALLVAGATPTLAQPHAVVGVWKLNVAKSKYDPGPAPKSQTRTYEQNGDGLKDVLESINLDGSQTKQSWSAHFDGKDNPFIGSPNFDTIAIKKIDALTWESTLKKGGKVVQTNRNTVSRDGRTMTSVVTGTNAAGKPVNNALLFEKQ
jgi:hypothetical protein